MELEEESTALVAPSNHGQKVKQELEKLCVLDKRYKVKRLENSLVAIPINIEQRDVSTIKNRWPSFQITKLQLPVSKKVKVKQNSPGAHLKDEVEVLLKEHDISKHLLSEVPSRWERHGDLVIVPATAFVSAAWNDIGDQLWKTVANSLSCKRVARHSSIADDGFRSSKMVMLLGEDGRVTHIDNGIKYSYDVTKCMFSAGNITEKLRIASFDCTGETVVDLYAGIGYFTLPYLVHAKAHHVHACEWNPEAVAALKTNLHTNGVAERCTVHEGDNRLLQLPPLADRVNLGLIPSSEDGWPVAVQLLKPSGGILHVHGNVTATREKYQKEGPGQERNADTSSDRNPEVERRDTEDDVCDRERQELSEKGRTAQACQNWSKYVQAQMQSLLEGTKGGQWSVNELHIEVVKSYAPHVLHVVLDLECNAIL